MVLVPDGFGPAGCSYTRSKSVGHVADVLGWLKSPSKKWRTSARLLQHNDPADGGTGGTVKAIAAVVHSCTCRSST